VGELGSDGTYLTQSVGTEIANSPRKYSHHMLEKDLQKTKPRIQHTSIWAYIRKTTVQKDTCTSTFTAALLTTAKHRPRKCPLID
jgi:ribosomal protein S3AE